MSTRSVTWREVGNATGPVARLLVRQSLAWMVWFWAVLALVFVTIGWLMERLGTLDRSVWEMAGTAPRWGLFVLGIVFATMYLPVLVAHGVTRRAAALAGGAAGLLLGLVAAAVMLAGYLVERAVYIGIDRAQYLEREHLFRTPVEAHLVLTEYALVFVAYLVSGWLVGIGYYRFGWILGTLFLVPAMTPAAGVDAVLSAGWTDSVLTHVNIGSGNIPAATGLGLALIVSGAAVAYTVTRTIAIKPRTT
jgi:hypothetical protein